MSFIQPEDSLRLLFEAIVFSSSWVRQLVNRQSEIVVDPKVTKILHALHSLGYFLVLLNQLKA